MKKALFLSQWIFIGSCYGYLFLSIYYFDEFYGPFDHGFHPRPYPFEFSALWFFISLFARYFCELPNRVPIALFLIPALFYLAIMLGFSLRNTIGVLS